MDQLRAFLTLSGDVPKFNELLIERAHLDRIPRYDAGMLSLALVECLTNTKVQNTISSI